MAIQRKIDTVLNLSSVLCPGFFMQKYYKAKIGPLLRKNNDKFIINLSFDLDLREDFDAIPFIIACLKKYNYKSSFACIGKWVELKRDEHKMIIDEGHEIINHTFSHPNSEVFNPQKKFNEISLQDMREEIVRCHELINRLLHYNPVGFRVPHFGNLYREDIYPVLSDNGYLYSSSTVALRTEKAGLPFKVMKGLFEIPLSPCPRHPFACLDTYHFFRSSNPLNRFIHPAKNDFLVSLRKLISNAKINDNYVNLYFDPLDLAKENLFCEVLELIKSEECCVLTYKELIECLS